MSKRMQNTSIVNDLKGASAYFSERERPNQHLTIPRQTEISLQLAEHIAPGERPNEGFTRTDMNERLNRTIHRTVQPNRIRPNGSIEQLERTLNTKRDNASSDAGFSCRY